LLEVNAVTRAVWHAHLADASADRLDVTWIAEAKALDTGSNFRFGHLIRETREPLIEVFGLEDLDDVCIL